MKNQKNKKRISIIVAVFVVVMGWGVLQISNANAEIIFEDNLDGQDDWTVSQPISGAIICDEYPCSEEPLNKWTGYLSGMSYCLGGPGYNSIYLNSAPGFPKNTVNGVGKSLTFWDESCVNFFEDSDAQLSKSFTDQEGVYLKFKIKFSPDYAWELTDINAHKLLHIRYWDKIESSFANFGIPGNVPIAIPGIKVDHDLGYPRLWYYVAFRCEESYYCQGTPKYTFDVGTDQDAVVIGNWNTTLGDGNWHTIEFYFKTNTNNGEIFNADGEHRFWLDGNLIYETVNIPFSDNGSEVSPRREWNWFSLGGNNNNRWITDCIGSECEQWYAIDDVIVSTTDIPDDYVIGGPDLTPPSVTTFEIPSTSTSLTVPITSFTATDNTAVTGYKLTETSDTPNANDSGWEVSPQTEYTFTTSGTKTLYAWAKDEAGNVSTSLNDSVTINLSTYSLSNFISAITNWLGVGNETSDVNSDGVVNTRDLGVMMSNWSQ